MNYRDIERAIAIGDTFTHNGTMTGVIENGNYNIYSYATKIYSRDLETCKEWLSTKKYSMTTSRQQNIIKRARRMDY